MSELVDMDISLSPSTTELKRWIEAIERDVLDDLRDFWDEGAKPLVKQEITRVFATEGYGGWPRLSPQYERRKSQERPGKTILQYDDNYFRAATLEGHPGNIYVAEHNMMIWGVDPEYFAAAFGFAYPVAHERGSGRLPQRPVFGIVAENDWLMNALVASFKKHLRQKIEAESRRIFR